MQGQLPTRAERFAALGAPAREFDLLVIGGGITGCGIAREAAARGLSVALVEKNDFASGTSSRSSRLIHGGVRYLEHGQIHLVFESSAERRQLLRLAPHLVRPLAFTWPVYAGARIPRWKLGLGLTAYDALALFRNVRRHRRLSTRGVLAREPGLASDGLRGGALYYDAATDDARLTLANAIGAAEIGAVVVNHASVRALEARDGRIVGARVDDELTRESVDVRAAVVVNATGPWSDTVRALDQSAPLPGARKAVRGSKGTHIAIRRERLGNHDALTLLSPMDGRVMFVLPAGAFAIVGTTDTFTTSSPDDVRPTAEDVSYLLATANRFFPAAKLGANDVVAAWAGIRPLLPSSRETPGAASREHAVTVSGAGLVSITGGKLTTYRVMAADVLRVVLRELGRPAGAAHLTPLPGGDIRSYEQLVADISRETDDASLSAHLAASYGSRWPRVWSEITSDGGDTRLADGLPYTAGELRYCARNEMAFTLGDLLIRRTKLAFETRDHGASIAARAAAVVAEPLGWDAPTQSGSVAAYAKEVQRIFSIEA
ncbi:MAG TPA: glycerol-3-phosphate dehydrogenase/oxidase [Gemmatimonadaceae bacterium]|jgi:glycerol-3-phosphate dehydrogenase|nr:glycerol-3-phosphate dehydrogenase/oxidase [Gemmatimonadaceae bacterium]